MPPVSTRGEYLTVPSYGRAAAAETALSMYPCMDLVNSRPYSADLIALMTSQRE